MKDRCCSRVTKATRHAQIRFKNIYTWTLFEVNSLLTRRWTCSWNAIRFPCILSNLHEFRIFGKLNSTITCIVVCYNYHYVLLWCVCISFFHVSTWRWGLFCFFGWKFLWSFYFGCGRAHDRLQKGPPALAEKREHSITVPWIEIHRELASAVVTYSFQSNTCPPPSWCD